MENIIPHTHKIKVKDRNLQNKHRSIVIWFTGFSGSGKSTLASLLEQELFKRNIHTYILDGDNIRTGLNKDLSFLDGDRKENIRRVSEVAFLMADAGIVTITAFISPFREDRQQAKNIIGKDKFIEVFADCPLEICMQRDPKGLYAKVRDHEIKNFTGVDSPFEAPENPDIIIPTHQQNQQESVNSLLEVILPKVCLEL